MRDPEVTHRIMAAIKSKDTKPEIFLRRALWGRGMRYRINEKELPGKPDIVFTRAKIVVFCDGDYWHGHNWALRGYASFEEELASYSPFWQEKIRKNVERDKANNMKLTEMGWRVLRFWESDIISNVELCADKIQSVYKERIALK